jgi:hypothetical protein
VAKPLEATLPLDRRYTSDQVQDALSRMLSALTFQSLPLRVEWYSPTQGRVFLAPFGYRQVALRLSIEQEGAQKQLRVQSTPINLFRVPLMYRRELRELWASILDRLRNLEAL